jgi:succinate dehydrogenase / fumarate reductase membrane anchor subunit
MHKGKVGLRSMLGRVKGLGSARNGTEHWWMQRFTALALIALVSWFIITSIRIVSADEETLLQIIKSPLNIITMMIFAVVSLYHGMLGMQVIIEDYVKEPCRLIVIVLLKFVTIATAITALSAIFAFHFAIFN